ncbi:MAG: hydrogenase nickel incorporation protein HypB [Syntrophothermus sp.]
MEIGLRRDVLGANAAVAAQIRAGLQESGTFCINLISSPGAGKTALLERTCELLKDRLSIRVIEGDISTTLDAERIRRHGIPACQVNTLGGCHLDAPMIRLALEELGSGTDQQWSDPSPGLLIIENVGNLVCPADFDLGEDAKVVVLSIPEGDDKPLKYPGIFQRAAVVLLNKIDLLPFSRFDLPEVREDLSRLNPGAAVYEVSATTGEGLDSWAQWLLEQVMKKWDASRSTRTPGRLPGR